ncbi:hypothetical protein C8R46DRAFT_1065066 [Mycena filopes]|nr:hypothetical protein C8R46DRAFT_1065066 [Mycena filopes]
MRQLSPLDIEELLERCIQYLHCSRRDLKACALVSRSWVYPAQSHLFRAPGVLPQLPQPSRSASTWDHFLQILSHSTHLIRHIRHLYITPKATTLSTLRAICTLQFTHLQSVSLVYLGDLSPDVVLLLQQLLSLPTLRRLTLACAIAEWESVLNLLDHCSPSLREIQFLCSREPPTRPPQTLLPLSPRGRITLTSLFMGSSHTVDYDLIRTPSLFDLSRLRLLYVGWSAEIPWPSFGPVVRHIEALSIFARTTPLDLASFPDLTCLRLALPRWIPREATLPMAIQILSGIGPANVIRKIVIGADVVTLDGHVCTQLDAALSSLPMPQRPRIEVELTAEEFEGVSPFFVRIRSHGLLGRVEALSSRDWWNLGL